MAACRTLRPAVEILEDRCLLATRIWDGGGLNNNWTNASNWASNVAPVAGDDLVFPSNVADKTADNNFAAGTHFRSITVHGGYTLKGARILLGVGGIVSNGSSNIISADIDLNAAGAGARPFLVNQGSTLFIDGEIRGGNGLDKTGAGNLSFRSNNSYSGLTNIKAGILFIEKDESLGAFNASSAGTIVSNGATLLVNDHALGAVRVDEPITIVGGGTLRALNDVELRGNLGTTGAATLRHEGGSIERLTISGQISGVGGVAISAGSQVRFQAANTYSGTTTVRGELQLDSADGPASAGDMAITATGTVRLMRHDQIADGAEVTVQGGGQLLGEGKNDTFKRLTLNGGRVDGKGVGGDSVFSVESFAATSSSATRSAEVVDVFIDLTILGIDVLDGPAFNDLIVRGLLYGDSVVHDGDTELALFGDGTTLVLAPRADRYVVDGGLLRINQFDEGGLIDLISTVEVVVRGGGSFAGDDAIGTLIVYPGGRVRPGPLSSTGTLSVDGDLFLSADAILEATLNGSSFDKIVVKGRVVVGDALLEPTLGPSVAVDQTYRIIVNEGTDAIEGAFKVPPDSFPFQSVPGTDFEVFFLYQTGPDFNDLTVKILDATPGSSAFSAIPPAKDGGAAKVKARSAEPNRIGAAPADLGLEAGGRSKSPADGRGHLPALALRQKESEADLSPGLQQRHDRRDSATVAWKGKRPAGHWLRELADMADRFFASGLKE